MNKKKGIDFSVVIPCHNECENLKIFLPDVIKTMSTENYEIVLINDGSSDQTEQWVTQNFPSVQLISHPQQLGLSSALTNGINHAHGQWIITIDGDGEVPAFYIKEAIQILKKNNQKNIAVFSERVSRKDGYTKSFQSTLGRKFMNFCLGGKWKSTISSLKIIEKKDLLSIPFFEGFHRFIPYFIKAQNIDCLSFPVHTIKRPFGQTHFNLTNRGLNTILDLWISYLLIKKIKRITHKKSKHNKKNLNT